MTHTLGTALILGVVLGPGIPAWRLRRRRHLDRQEQQLLRTISRTRRHPTDNFGPADINRALATICRRQAAYDQAATRTHQEH